MKFIIHTIGLAFLSCLLCACEKINEGLDVKVNKGDVVPKTVDEFQSLLDNDSKMNANYAGLANLGCDNFYLMSNNWASSSILERNSYIWKPDLLEAGEIFDWNAAYGNIEYSNIALDGLKKIERTSDNGQAFDNVKGSALFFKSVSYFNLVHVFAKPYSSSSNIDLGIPLKGSSDVNEKIERGTVAKVYDEIIANLMLAKDLLPEKPRVAFRPSMPAAYALLAKTYLHKEQWDSTLKYAKSALAISDFLYDFNTFRATANYPYPNVRVGNGEIIFYATQASYSSVVPYGVSIVDSTFYSDYDTNDLRRSLLFRVVPNSGGRIGWKGSISGNAINFAGIATAELYLMAAESAARADKLDDASYFLNNLLRKRYRSSTYRDTTFSTKDGAIDEILRHRRKEFPITGIIRWEDLRRLNKDPRYAKTVIHIVDGQAFVLPPGDNRYVFPLPLREVQNHKLEQNLR